MYRKKEKVYCEAGHYLRSASTVGYVLPYSEGILEVKQKFDFKILGPGIRVITWSNGLLALELKTDYNELKKDIISLKYSNDDQIAIMINAEEDPVPYKKMQEWRIFASELAKKILEYIEKQQ